MELIWQRDFRKKEIAAASVHNREGRDEAG